IKSKTVVFPAPFGPITLIISFGLTSKSRSCTAARPPKNLLTLFSFSKGSPVCSIGCSTLIILSCSLLLNTHLGFEARRSWHHVQCSYLYFMIFFYRVEFTPSTRTRNKAFWPEDHNHDQDDTEDQVPNIVEGEARNKMNNRVVNREKWIGRICSQSIELCEK